MQVPRPNKVKHLNMNTASIDTIPFFSLHLPLSSFQSERSPIGRFVRRIMTFAALILLGAYLAVGGAAQAGESAPASANAADEFLRANETGKVVLDSLHFGTTYKGHEFRYWTRITDSVGNVAPGEFALVYRYFWNDDDHTDVVFFCDAHGKVYRVKAGDSTAIFNQPFLAANLAIKALGNLLLSGFGDKMTPQQKENYQRFIDNADAKGMLELTLQVRQALW